MAASGKKRIDTVEQHPITEGVFLPWESAGRRISHPPLKHASGELPNRSHRGTNILVCACLFFLLFGFYVAGGGERDPVAAAADDNVGFFLCFSLLESRGGSTPVGTRCKEGSCAPGQLLCSSYERCRLALRLYVEAVGQCISSFDDELRGSTAPFILRRSCACDVSLRRRRGGFIPC